MNERKHILINLCKQEWEISTRISFGDLKKIEESIHNTTTDFQRIFADFIYDKIIGDNKPSIDDIYTDDSLKICAEKFIEADKKIEEFFMINIEKMDFYKATLFSIYEKHDEEIKEILKGLPKINDDMLAGISSVLNSFSKSVVKIVTSPIIENIVKMTTQFSEALGKIAINIGNMLKDIKIPTISEERKEALILSYKAWGSYGWTMMPDLPLQGFSDCPADIKEANKLALSYCTNSNMERLFDILRDMKGVKKSDLEEAIFDFKHGKYKSCVLVLFGLIDAKLIRLQKKEKDPKKKRRAVGQRAANEVLKNIKNEQDLEKQFFLLLDYENILACLNTIFANAEDFRKQPIVINRNFVDHGMMTKRVIRKDCVQVFMLYYNLLMFLDFMG